MCFSVSIQSSRFSYFNFKMNPRNIPVMVNPALGMQFQGKILNIKGFAGPVTINRTVFEQNTLAFHTCDGWADVESDIQTSQYEYLTNKNALQIKNLISIRENQNSIVITENTFQYNSVVKGLIYIENVKNMTTYS